MPWQESKETVLIGCIFSVKKKHGYKLKMKMERRRWRLGIEERYEIVILENGKV